MASLKTELGSVKLYPTVSLNDRFARRVQTIAATHSANVSTGV
ncbi:hypothetical protein ACVWXO_010001 [Bradyrhizobium sp. LM2.7]